jgi:hypothetical protein
MDPDPGGPKTYGSYGSGSATLVQIKVQLIFFADSSLQCGLLCMYNNELNISCEKQLVVCT